MQSTTQQSGQTAVTTQDNEVVVKSGIVLDKTKSSAQYIRDAEENYIIPVLIRENFPDLVKLIIETDSMDDEEREYWLSIMPVMTEDQIIKLRDILVNERDQLTRISQGYQQSPQRRNVTPLDESKLKAQFERIREAEEIQQEKEKEKQMELLRILEEI